MGSSAFGLDRFIRRSYNVAVSPTIGTGELLPDLDMSDALRNFEWSLLDVALLTAIISRRARLSSTIDEIMGITCAEMGVPRPHGRDDFVIIRLYQMSHLEVGVLDQRWNDGRDHCLHKYFPTKLARKILPRLVEWAEQERKIRVPYLREWDR